MKSLRSLLLCTCSIVLGSWMKEIQAANGDDIFIARILNGSPIKIVNYPFFAYLENCGGAIISDLWIVTAAHCVVLEVIFVQYFPRPVYVGGSTKSHCRRYYYDKVVIHPGFLNIDDTKHDIALLQLTQRLWFSPEVQPIQLPKTQFSSGWMTLISKGKDETGKVSEVVQMVNLYGYNDKKCQRRANGEVFCAVRDKLKPGTCFGDSGSPLVRGRTLIGIVSAIGEEFCYINKYTYAVNVAYYTPWITYITGIN